MAFTPVDYVDTTYTTGATRHKQYGDPIASHSAQMPSALLSTQSVHNERVYKKGGIIILQRARVRINCIKVRPWSSAFVVQCR